MANANTCSDDCTTLFDNGDFSLRARIQSVTSPAGGLALTITSHRQLARDPLSAQVRFFACLDRQGLLALRGLLDAALQGPAARAGS